ADEYGNAEETGVCVMDNNEEVLVDHEHAPGLSSTFGQLVKKEMAALEKQKEEEKQRSRKKLSDFLDG
ncbi:hypothetical protein KY336_03855, partial [Candidatus Woesearchaeota archaeon]|nr:hypothetical protein [Candidatus Woesearchaeota archaeon]